MPISSLQTTEFEGHLNWGRMETNVTFLPFLCSSIPVTSYVTKLNPLLAVYQEALNLIKSILNYYPLD